MKKKEIFKLLKNDGNQLEFLEDKYKNDKDMVMVALIQNPDSFKFCSQNLKSNIEVVKSAVRKKIENAQYIDNAFFQNPKNVFTVLKHKPKSFQFFPKEFQKDSWCKMCYYRFTGEKIGKYSQKTDLLMNLITFDKYRTWKLIKEDVNENAILCAHALSMIRNVPESRQILEKFSQNKEFYRTMCSNQKGYICRFCVSDLLDDSDFFFELLAMDYSIFSCLSFKYIRNESFIRQCLIVNSEVYKEYFTKENYYEKYLKSSDLLFLVIEKQPSYIGLATVKNLDVYKQAIWINRNVWNHINFRNFNDFEKKELYDFYFGILKFHGQLGNLKKFININFNFQ
jgi:hypothetical protein